MREAILLFPSLTPALWRKQVHMAQIKVSGTKQAQWTKSKHLYSKHPINRLASVELSGAQSIRQLAVSRPTEKGDKLHRENYRSSLKS